ncbi:acyl carrier protein [Actinocrinis puniceicyclus]|uniref:Acyl carrier protein n=1 Tax=Actinocrinis puniceicyclus TaxID=977794 RepID=A0A8J8BCM8_9ACTN|nr:acyl carrier protein [Actinocrinis puniceicyclus]MBS2963685.1 acyl carrier protein [Actinocrinis puniceicyclus]
MNTVTTVDDFVQLIADGLGLPVTAEDVDRDLDQIAGWDSLHLLWLVTALERQTGRSVPMVELLRARSLGEIYAAVTS